MSEYATSASHKSLKSLSLTKSAYGRTTPPLRWADNHRPHAHYHYYQYYHYYQLLHLLLCCLQTSSSLPRVWWRLPVRMSGSLGEPSLSAPSWSGESSTTGQKHEAAKMTSPADGPFPETPLSWTVRWVGTCYYLVGSISKSCLLLRKIRIRECEGACLPACLPVWSNAPAATRSSDPCDIVHLPDMFTAKLRDPLALIVLLAAAGLLP